MSKTYTSQHIYHITDAFDHRARGKVDGAYSLHRGKLGIRDAGYSFIPAVNTIDIGISVSEFISNTQRPERIVFSVNCAPPDKKEGTTDNVRNDFFCAQLKDGVTIAGTSNGYELAYVKEEIVELFRLTNTNKLKSQFRSLEILPEHSLLFSQPEHRAQLVTDGILKRVEHVDDIVPTIPKTTHVHEVDNFQNVKLLLAKRDLTLLKRSEGQNILFRFGQTSIEANERRLAGNDNHGVVAPTLFAAPLLTNVIALRSSSKLLLQQGIEDVNVPIIATIRERPAETDPKYTVPGVGAPVWLRRASAGLRAA